MDFEREFELESAGIDAFEFSLMDEEERAEALTDAGLDPGDYEDIELESEFQAWSALQDNGIDLMDLEFMDEDEKREALEEADLDPDEYDLDPVWYEPVSAAPGPFPAPVRQAVPDPPTISAPKAPALPEIPRAEAAKPLLREAAAAEPLKYEPKNVCKEISTPVFRETKPEPTPVSPGPRREQGGIGWWLIGAAALFVLLVFLGTTGRSTSSSYRAVGSYSTRSSSSESSGRSYYSSSTSSRLSSRSTTPPCPPVNREPAMTREEAERLSGTGYHGTRPNSSAVNTELAAAQVRCRYCGYHSHNGANSLCDYCSWIDRYGGGLPSQSAPAVTPRTSTSSHSTSKPSSGDSYHASDYSDPDDFYYDYYDDFWDYEDAEDYWEEYD